LQFIQEPYFYTVPQFALDYLVAFAVLGFAALGAKLPGKDIVKLPIGVALGGLLRTISSFLSGLSVLCRICARGHASGWLFPSLQFFQHWCGYACLHCRRRASGGHGHLTMLKKSAAQHR
jgi:thiamine transporter ThiT